MATIDKERLKYFRTLLLKIRNDIGEELKSIQTDFQHSIKESTGEHSSMSFHLADIGTDAFEREKSYIVASMESNVLQDIDDALTKIDAGDYGICEQCGIPISLQRLEALPYARLCIDCKSKEE